MRSLVGEVLLRAGLQQGCVLLGCGIPQGKPFSSRRSTYDYLCENDDFTRWLDDHFRKLDDENGKPDGRKCVKLKQMCSLFKDRYLRQGSRENRQMTVENFLERLQENIKWKHIVRQRYKERTRVKGLNVRMVLIGMEWNSDNDSSDDEEM
jgi:hypothetical protein